MIARIYEFVFNFYGESFFRFLLRRQQVKGEEKNWTAPNWDVNFMFTSTIKKTPTMKNIFSLLFIFITQTKIMPKESTKWSVDFHIA